MHWAMMTLSILLFFCAIILIILACCLRKSSFKLESYEYLNSASKSPDIIENDLYDTGPALENLVTFIKNSPSQRWNGWSIADPPTVQSPVYSLADAPKLAPVIIIPGLGGSILHMRWNFDNEQFKEFQAEVDNILCLQKKKTWEQAWPSLNGVKPVWMGAACWRYKMDPMYNKRNGFINKLGVEVTAWRTYPLDLNDDLVISDDFGGTAGVDILLKLGDINLAYMFNRLILDLRSNGYVDKQSLFGAPYDFRRITGKQYSWIYYKALKKLIEHAVKSNGKKAIILSHSLGCSTFKIFLSGYLPQMLGEENAQKWKDEYLQIWMPIGAPFGGSPKSLKIIISGDHMGMGQLCIGQECNFWYQKLQKNISGVIWMVPTEEIFHGVDVLARSPFIIPGKKSDLKRLYETVNAMNASSSINDMPPAALMLRPPLVKVLAINGSSADTAMNFEYEDIHDTSITPNDGPIRTYTESFTYGRFVADTKAMNAIQQEIFSGTFPGDMIGDDTVPWISLNVSKIWQKGGSKENSINGHYKDVTIKTFVGPEMLHKDMLDVREVRDFIVESVFANQADI